MPHPAHTPVRTIDEVRSRFPSLSVTDDGRPRIYLDNPAGTQVPVDVIDRMAVVTPNPLCVATNLEDLEGGWCLVGNHLDVS